MIRSKGVLAVLAGYAVCAATVCVAVQPTMGDFSGVWWPTDPTPRLLPADGKPLPFTAAGSALYDKNVAGLKSGALVDQADYACAPQGMPRAMTSAYPFQIIVTPSLIVFAHEQNRAYWIAAIAEQHQDPKIWDPSYMGDGIARLQDGDLLIDSTNFNADAIFIDGSGVPVSPQLHLTERFKLSAGGKRLEDLITVDDPAVFSRPWSARRVFTRRDDVSVRVDWVCGEPHRRLPATERATQAHPVTLTAAQAALSGYWHIGRPPAGPPPGSVAADAAPADAPRRAPGPENFKLTASAAAYRAAQQAAAAAGKTVYNPTALCLPASVPGTYLAGAYQNAILFEPRQVTILYEDGHNMISVAMDRGHPADLTPSWTGDSVGHWEGSTLVIDSIGFNGKNLVPNVGVPMSQQMHIVQRLTPTDSGQIQVQVTMDDPAVFTEPFTRTFLLERGKPWQEYVCQENSLEGGYPTSTGRPKPAVFGEMPPTSAPVIGP